MAEFDLSGLRRIGGAVGYTRYSSLPTFTDIFITTATRSQISGSATIRFPRVGSTRGRFTYRGEFNLSEGRGTADGVFISTARYGSFSARGLDLDLQDAIRAGGSLRRTKALEKKLVGGNDVIEGSPQADALLGRAGDDIIFGGPGDDLIGGGTGFNRVSGGLGSDTFRLEVGAGHTTITDFKPRVDKLSFAGVRGLRSVKSGSTWEVFSGGGDLLARFLRLASDPLNA